MSINTETAVGIKIIIILIFIITCPVLGKADKASLKE